MTRTTPARPARVVLELVAFVGDLALAYAVLGGVWTTLGTIPMVLLGVVLFAASVVMMRREAGDAVVRALGAGLSFGTVLSVLYLGGLSLSMANFD
jgi:hypothetical protein